MATGEGARGAAALLARAELRGGARPEMAILGLPGVKKDEIWVGKHLLGAGDPHVASERRCGAGKGLLDGEGGSVAKGLAGVSGVWPLRCAKGEYN